MKTLLSIVFVVFVTLTANSQTMEKEYFNHLQGVKQKPGTRPEFELRLTPRPTKIWIHGNKVTVTYNRKEWNRAQELNKLRNNRPKNIKNPRR